LAHNPWSQSPIIYQIYPRSFLDTSGTGVGDLDGVRRKLDYVASLNVDAIWLSPIYPSPWIDGGYDVSDHAGVHPALGTEQIVKALIDETHARDMNVVLDQVLNHTSDQNPWFEKSVNREEGFDDWYIWRDSKPDGSAPNNWLSFFGGPAWSWNHIREQYYRHQFLSCQPNLNMRNPAVQGAHRAQMRHWREMGVDGFRMDVVSAYLYDESFADNPPASAEVAARAAGPKLLPYNKQDHEFDILPGDGAAYTELLREWVGPDVYLIGEMNVGNNAIELAQEFARPGRLDTAYTIDIAEQGFTAENYHNVLSRIDDLGCSGFWLSSHDQARHVSAHGDATDHDAKFMGLVCGVMPGPWLIYQGEELALHQPELNKDEATDPFDLAIWPLGDGREGARVPIPWTEEQETFGFTEGAPWLPMRWNKGQSVEAHEKRKDSVLYFYRTLTALRKEHGWAFAQATQQSFAVDVLRLCITTQTGTFYIVANFGMADAVDATIPGIDPLISSGPVKPKLMPARTAAIWKGGPDG